MVDEQGQMVDGATIIPSSRARVENHHTIGLYSKEAVISSVRGNTEGTPSLFNYEKPVVQKVKNGRFILENIPAGLEALRVSHPDYCFAIVKDIEVIEGQTTGPIEVVLTKGGIVQGHVPKNSSYQYLIGSLSGQKIEFRCASLEPFPNSFYGDEIAGLVATARTDPNGFYQVTRLPQQKIYVSRSGIRIGKMGYLGITHGTVVPVNGEVTTLDFGIGKPTLKGQIVVDEKPIGGCKVYLKLANGPEQAFGANALTDDKGCFYFEGIPAGSYRISSRIPGHASEALKGSDTTIEVGTVDIANEDIDVGAIKVNIGVGKPVLKGKIVVNEQLRGDCRIYLKRINGPEEAFSPNVLPDHKGYFYFEGVPAGSYRINCRIPEYVSEALESDMIVELLTVEIEDENVDLGVIPVLIDDPNTTE